MTAPTSKPAPPGHPGTRQIPRVSVGLPVFNGAMYLERCLASILGQTFGDFELVISDNASQDQTADICVALAAQDSRVRYIRNPTNIGILENFAAVASHARADLFAWIGCDDIWEPQFLETLVRALDSNPSANLAYGNYNWIDGAGKCCRAGSIQLAQWLPAFLAPYLRFSTANSRVGNMCLYWWWRNPFLVYGLFRRASLMPALPFEYLFDDCRQADNLMLMRFLSRNDVVVVDAVLFHYRMKERDLLGASGSYYAAGGRTKTNLSSSLDEERILLDRVLTVVLASVSSPIQREFLGLALPTISRARKVWMWTQSRWRGLV